MLPWEVMEMAKLEDQLLQDLRRLAPADLGAVQSFVRVLLADPEKLTPEEAAEFEAGRQEIARGEYVVWDPARKGPCLRSE
jgi:hypothetical protein